ncbi:MAG: HAD family hydrolase [Paludibacter sp.]|nr:HAD family hydrolase [Paludibacter sp.]
MKYEAIIFDLFGTLVNVVSKKKLEEVLAKMAFVLDVPAESFTRLWRETSDDRNKGVFKDINDNIRFIVNRLGFRPVSHQIDVAVKLRLEYTRRSLKPKDDTISLLTEIKKNGYKIGIVSDSSIDVPIFWHKIPFCSLVDKIVFSCLVGFKKPDPRIYRLVTDFLNVDPKNCIYVGDGGSQELSGAFKVGMHPLKIRSSNENNDDAERPGEDSWQGAEISSLSELLNFLRES